MPHLKKPALTISLLPEDVGKPTFKLEKAAVQDGTCSWEKPIYVTVKLIRQAKTGKLNEKIYHFIVSSVRILTFQAFLFQGLAGLLVLANSTISCRDLQNQVILEKLQLILQILRRKPSH